jgi:glycopeptide antibiotics resistance protein
MEFSKKIMIVIVIWAMLCVSFSYFLSFHGKDDSDSVSIALITTIVGSYVGYLIYQFKLKDSRNKHGIDENGKPFEPEETEENL